MKIINYFKYFLSVYDIKMFIIYYEILWNFKCILIYFKVITTEQFRYNINLYNDIDQTNGLIMKIINENKVLYI